MTQRILESDTANRHLRELRSGLASVNLRKVNNIQEAVVALVAAVGGKEIMRERFRTRSALDIALADIDFDEILANTRWNLNFSVPYGELPQIAMGDMDYRGLTVVEVVRGVFGAKIREDFLKIVFPYAREKKLPSGAPAVRAPRAAATGKGNGV